MFPFPPSSGIRTLFPSASWKTLATKYCWAVGCGSTHCVLKMLESSSALLVMKPETYRRTPTWMWLVSKELWYGIDGLPCHFWRWSYIHQISPPLCACLGQLAEPWFCRCPSCKVALKCPLWPEHYLLKPVEKLPMTSGAWGKLSYFMLQKENLVKRKKKERLIVKYFYLSFILQ